MTTTVDPENSQSGSTLPEDTPIEGTVFTPRQVGMLKIAVVVMGVLILAALAALIVGMIYQASKIGGKTTSAAPPAHVAPAAAPERIATSPATAITPEALVIPGLADVISMSLDGDRLALHVRMGDDAEIVVVEIATGKVLSRIRIDKRDRPLQ